MKKDTLRVFGVLLAAALFVSISVGAVCAGSDFPTYHGDYQRTGTAASNGPVTNVTVQEIKITDVKGTGSPDGAPVVHDGHVYITTWWGTSNGKGLYCFDAKTGDLEWSIPELGGCRAGITIDGNYLYVGSSSGKLSRVNLSTHTIEGETKETYTGSSWSSTFASAVAVANDKVYFSVPTDKNGAALYVYNKDLSKLEGTVKPAEGLVSGAYYSAVSLSEDKKTVFIPGGKGVFAVDADTLAIKAVSYDVVDADSKVTVSSPAYKAGNIYFTAFLSSTSTKLYAFNASTGDKLWEAEYTASQACSPVISENAVFVTGSEGLYKFNRTTGKAEGVHKSGRVQFSPVVLAGNTVYYGTYSCGLYAVDADSMNEVWALTPPGASTTPSGGVPLIESSPAVADGVLYVGVEKEDALYIIKSGDTGLVPENVIDSTIYLPYQGTQVTIKELLDEERSGMSELIKEYKLTSDNAIEAIAYTSAYGGSVSELTNSASGKWMMYKISTKGEKTLITGVDTKLNTNEGFVLYYNVTDGDKLGSKGIIQYKLNIVKPAKTITKSLTLDSAAGTPKLSDALETAKREGYIDDYVASDGLITFITVNGVKYEPEAGDYYHSWMHILYNNKDIPSSGDYELDEGATISLHYDELDATDWHTKSTAILLNLKVEKITDDKIILKSGWNFISVPKALAKPAAEDFFSPVSKSGFAPMTWDAENEKWITVSENTKVTPLTGYWVYAEKPTTLYVVYDKDVTSVPASKRVYEGWNAVGVSGTKTMTAETAFANVDWVLAHVWNVSEGIFKAEAISPNPSNPTELPQYSGLWLYSNEDKGIPGYL